MQTSHNIIVRACVCKPIFASQAKVTFSISYRLYDTHTQTHRYLPAPSASGVAADAPSPAAALPRGYLPSLFETSAAAASCYRHTAHTCLYTRTRMHMPRSINIRAYPHTHVSAHKNYANFQSNLPRILMSTVAVSVAVCVLQCVHIKLATHTQVGVCCSVCCSVCVAVHAHQTCHAYSCLQLQCVLQCVCCSACTSNLPCILMSTHSHTQVYVSSFDSVQNQDRDSPPLFLVFVRKINPSFKGPMYTHTHVVQCV